MKHFYLILSLFFCLLGYSQQTKKVLFLGNSYTNYNNLPLLIQQIAQSSGDNLFVDSHTPGGYRLMDHSTDVTVSNKIKSNNWDYVVLQEQSQMPAFPINYVNQSVFPYATQLVNSAKKNYSCTVPIFYTTWGRKFGDPQICLNGKCTYEVMDDLLQQRYRTMAINNNGVVSPVAQVWRNIRLNYPNIELYAADNSHPSLEGSMAAAYTFYVVLFKKDPTLLQFNGGLSNNNAAVIKNVVKNVVYNNMDNYFIDVNDNYANFSASIINGTQVQFTNNTTNATSLVWDFGDGGSSNQQNPTHKFANNGIYTISLKLTVCGVTYTKVKQIDISKLNVNKVIANDLILYPNPANSFISIKNLNYDKVEIIDVNGKIFKVDTETSNGFLIIDINDFKQGTYFLRLSKSSNYQYFKFIKN